MLKGFIESKSVYMKATSYLFLFFVVNIQTTSAWLSWGNTLSCFTDLFFFLCLLEILTEFFSVFTAPSSYLKHSKGVFTCKISYRYELHSGTSFQFHTAFTWTTQILTRGWRMNQNNNGVQWSTAIKYVFFCCFGNHTNHKCFTQSKHNMVRATALGCSPLSRCILKKRKIRGKRCFWVKPGRKDLWWQNMIQNRCLEEDWRKNFRMSKNEFTKLVDS